MTDAHDGQSTLDMNEIRQRMLALQKSASNLAQLDLGDLASLLPPGTSRERLIEIKTKLVQLHNLQNRRNNMSDNADDNLNTTADGVSNRSSRYKTELCRPFEENGMCKYGARCQFAHGAAELRTLARHPKYKSQLCRTFHSNGLCPYGHRCHFIHNQDEIRPVVPLSPTMHTNQSFNDASNIRGNESHYPEYPYNDWGRQATFPHLSNETFQKAFSNPSIKSSMPRFGPVNANDLSMIPNANSSLRNLNTLSTGLSLGSAGELSPPVSPIVFGADDPFTSQTSFRPGYVNANLLSEIPELNFNQMMALSKLSAPATAFASPTPAHSNSFSSLTPSPEHSKTSSSQNLLSPFWWKTD
ncbi:protein TIS11 [Galendromus occidentalis]|uniref:Protein TIS11 n=1 Tax=Galendromus occidentalis TaxID=34638 RepID=A0AAJ7L936_9ACAR|nr:protein TIS11 [Galendromus occidentalis]